MAVDPVALKSELTTDPAALGYAAPLAVGNSTALVNLLNAVQAGAQYSFFRNNVQEKDVVGAIASADFKTLTALQIAKLQFLFPAGATLDATAANTRQILVDIFGAASAGTLNALVAVGSRQGSRAELLFGPGTAITTTDIAHALNS